jgi:formylmethanofuran dehydrogenase subunit E
VLFRVQQVDALISEFDLPGPTRARVACDQCGQIVRDHRETIQNGRALCRPCAGDVYFKNAREITWPDMNWSPEREGGDASGKGQHPGRPK